LLSTIADDSPEFSENIEVFEDSYSVVAKLQGADSECKDALWARDQSLESPELAKLEMLTEGVLSRRVLRAFRARKMHKAIQKEHGGDQPWDAIWGTPKVQRISFKGQSYYSVAASVGGCGEFEGRYAALFKRAESGALELVSEHRDGGTLVDILAAADMDGDDELEFVVNSMEVNLAFIDNLSSLALGQRYSVPVFYCTC
jgi:hypothetical protein